MLIIFNRYSGLIADFVLWVRHMSYRHVVLGCDYNTCTIHPYKLLASLYIVILFLLHRQSALPPTLLVTISGILGCLFQFFSLFHCISFSDICISEIVYSSVFIWHVYTCFIRYMELFEEYATSQSALSR